MAALNGAKLATTEFQPQNNKQAYLGYMVGLLTDAAALPTPRTMEEVLLYNYCLGGGGTSGAADALIITERDEDGSPLAVDASKLAVLHSSQFYAGRSNSPWYKTKTFVLPSGVTELPAYVFAYCNGIENFVVPDSVETVGQYAFTDCTKLKSITFGEGVTFIGDHAFDGCSALVEVNFSENLRTIDDYAFRDCGNLESITFPPNVELIESYSFMGCSKLKTVTFEGVPGELSSAAFMNVTSITDIYVPWAEGAVAGAPWGATNATVHYNS